MITLAIDTSAAASVALVDGSGTVLAQSTEFHARRHVEHVGTAITQVTAGQPAPDRVLVGVGPGPFTGLRAGIAAGIGYAIGRGIDIHGVRSHDALAMACRQAGITGELVVDTDARRKEVYWSRYRLHAPAAAGAQTPRAFELLDGPAVDAPAQLAERTQRTGTGRGPGVLTAVGRGFELYAQVLGSPSLSGDEFSEPQAAFLALAALAQPASELLPVSPLYLREPDAQPLPGR